MSEAADEEAGHGTGETSPPLPGEVSSKLCGNCGQPQRPGLSTCPWCEQAERWQLSREGAGHTTRDDEKTFTGLLWAFGLMLVSNVILAFGLKDTNPEQLPTMEECRSYLTAISIVEGVDAVIVLVCLFSLFRFLRLPAEAGRSRRAAWALALPLLAGLLAVNAGYHHLLLWLSGSEPLRDQMAESGHFPLWQLATHCVQPAIVEELFFRGVAFGWLCRAVGHGNAAFATASMFAAVHTGGLASFPVLFLIGAGLAWIRWKSGSLLLPMLLHFLHNYIVGLL